MPLDARQSNFLVFDRRVSIQWSRKRTAIKRVLTQPYFVMKSGDMSPQTCALLYCSVFKELDRLRGLRSCTKGHYFLAVCLVRAPQRRVTKVSLRPGDKRVKPLRQSFFAGVASFEKMLSQEEYPSLQGFGGDRLANGDHTTPRPASVSRNFPFA